MVEGEAALTATSNRLVGLQWGRALAALAVVVTHAIAHPFPSAPGLTHLLGRTGVTLFFVISGYIMVATTGRGGFAPFEFMRRRLLRIAPLYYVATAVTALGALFIPWAFKQTVWDPQHLLMSLLFIPSYAPSGALQPVMKLGWTLNYEMFFYLCFAALFAFRALTRTLILTLAFVALTVAGLVFDFTAAPLAFYAKIDLLGFVAGMWVAILAQQRPIRLKLPLTSALLTFTTLSLVLMSVFYADIREAPATQVWLVVVCAAIIVVLIFGVAPVTRKAPRWFAFLGDASYSMYLFHIFAVAAVTVAVKRLLPPEFLVPGMIAAAAAGVAAGLIVYLLIERPLNTLTRGWLRVPKPGPRNAIEPTAP